MDHPLVLPIVLQVIGIAIVMAEVLIPSGGLLSILAIVLFGYSLYSIFTMVSTNVGVGFLLADMVIIPLVVVMGFKYLAKSSITLRNKLSSDLGVNAQKKTLKDYIGREGTAITDLRPSGIARIGKERLDVITDGKYLVKNTPLKVVSVAGNQVIVKETTKHGETQ